MTDPRPRRKATTRECSRIRLARRGRVIVTSGRGRQVVKLGSGLPSLVLSIGVPGRQSSTAVLSLVGVPIRYGVRRYFRCPRCGAIRRDLYAASDGIGCRGRDCLRLGYESERRHDARVDALVRDPRLLAEASRYARRTNHAPTLALLYLAAKKLEARKQLKRRRADSPDKET